MSSTSSVLRIMVAIGLFSTTHAALAQLFIQQDQVPTVLVHNALLGADVIASNVQFNGFPGMTMPPDEEGKRFGRFAGANTNLGLAAGTILFTGDATYAIGPNDEETVGAGGNPFTPTPDLDLCLLANGPDCALHNGSGLIHHKAVLEFDFVPLNDMISFRYVFSSEEYERWTCTQYNDAFGMFLRGPGISGPYEHNAMNIAFVPGSLSPVSINTVNSGLVPNNANGADSLNPFAPCYEADPNWVNNTAYYIYNGGLIAGVIGGPQTEEPYCCDPYYIQHNGLTVVLTASAAVQIGATYHMKMAVANVGDWRVPSAVYIEQGSFACGDRFTLTVDDGPNVNTSGSGPIVYESDVDSVYLRFNRWGGFYLDEYLQIAVGGSAIVGVDYSPALPDSIHFNQLDSSAVFALALPVHADEQRELVINLITSNGAKVMSEHVVIAPEGTVDVVHLQRPLDRLSLFPNPATGTLHVGLPEGLHGNTVLHVLDASGRLVMQQNFSDVTRTSVDTSGLPNGLYTVKTGTQGRIATARVNVQH